MCVSGVDGGFKICIKGKDEDDGYCLALKPEEQNVALLRLYFHFVVGLSDCFWH